PARRHDRRHVGDNEAALPEDVSPLPGTPDVCRPFGEPVCQWAADPAATRVRSVRAGAVFSRRRDTRTPKELRPARERLRGLCLPGPGADAARAGRWTRVADGRVRAAGPRARPGAAADPDGLCRRSHAAMALSELPLVPLPVALRGFRSAGD